MWLQGLACYWPITAEQIVSMCFSSLESESSQTATHELTMRAEIRLIGKKHSSLELRYKITDMDINLQIIIFLVPCYSLCFWIHIFTFSYVFYAFLWQKEKMKWAHVDHITVCNLSGHLLHLQIDVPWLKFSVWLCWCNKMFGQVLEKNLVQYNLWTFINNGQYQLSVSAFL